MHPTPKGRSDRHWEESTWVSDIHRVCPYIRGQINVGIGRIANHPSESVPTYGNESMWVSDGQQITPRGLSLHEGANQRGGILIFHLSLPRANSGGTPACRDRPRVCPPPSVRQGWDKHVIRQTTKDCECIRLPRDGRTDTGKNKRGYRTDTESVPT